MTETSMTEISSPLTIPSTNTVIWAVVVAVGIYFIVKNDVLGIRSSLGLESKEPE